MYDVIIIGAGPAGISASLYTRKSKFKNNGNIWWTVKFGKNR